MVYQPQMATSWSLLGPRTNLIDRKCCIFNGEKDDVSGLGSEIYLLMIFDPMKNLVRINTYMMCVNGEIWCTNYRWLHLGQY